jgi:hypothetical protein
METPEQKSELIQAGLKGNKGRWKMTRVEVVRNNMSIKDVKELCL